MTGWGSSDLKKPAKMYVHVDWANSTLLFQETRGTQCNAVVTAVGSGADP